MDITFTGVIVEVSPVQQGNSKKDGKPWAKQEFVIEFQEGNFPSKACFSVWGADKVKDLEKYQPGDQIKVAFNVSSREFNGKWYTDLRAWRISPAGAQAPASGYGAPAYGQNTAGTAPASGYQDVPAGFAPSYGAGPQQVPPHSIEDMPEDDLPF